MKIFNKLALGAAALMGTATMGAGVIYAANATPTNNPMGNLASAIATKFNLNTEEVQKVFEEQRALMQQQRQEQQLARQKTALDQAVKDGKITQAQEDLIIAKHQEFQAFMATLKDKTQEERETAMKTEIDAVQAWAKTNNIPDEYVAFGQGGHGPGGEGKDEMRDPKAMLDQAVKDGKITQAQEDLIIAKRTETQTLRDGLKNKTEAERQAAMKTQNESLKSWAKTNNIPARFVMGMGIKGGPRGGARGMMGEVGNESPDGVASQTTAN